LPGILMSKRWVLSYCAWSYPWGLITKAVLKNF